MESLLLSRMAEVFAKKLHATRKLPLAMDAQRGSGQGFQVEEMQSESAAL